MFNLKINTAIQIVLLFFLSLLTFISISSTYALFKSQDLYNKVERLDERKEQLAAVIIKVFDISARLNYIAYDKYGNNIFNKEMVDSIKNISDESRTIIAGWVQAPKEIDAAQEVSEKTQQALDLYLKVVTEKIASIERGETTDLNLGASAAPFWAGVNEYSGLSHDVKVKINGEISRSANTGYLIAIISIIFTLAVFILIRIWMRRQIIDRLNRVNQHLNEVGKGNLAASIDDGTSNEIGETIRGLKSMQSNLIKLISQVRNSAETITAGANQISSGSNKLSSNTEALQQTTASMEQIRITVKQNVEKASQANDLVAKARQTAMEGGKAAEETRLLMDTIQESSKAISEINSIITNIAGQTDILALNAAVEAARAGEQGRGFAVVASEVRSLAQRSSTAAQQIRSLINQTTSQITSGVQLVTETNHKIKTAVESVTQVSSLIEEIKTGAEDQNRVIEHVSESMNAIDSVTHQNTALLAQTAKATSSLHEQAQQLMDKVYFFRLRDEKKRPPVAAANAGVKEKAVFTNHSRNTRSVDGSRWETF